MLHTIEAVVRWKRKLEFIVSDIVRWQDTQSQPHHHHHRPHMYIIIYAHRILHAPSTLELIIYYTMYIETSWVSHAWHCPTKWAAKNRRRYAYVQFVGTEIVWEARNRKKEKNQCAMCLFTLAFYVSTGCPVSIRFFTCYFFFLIFVANEISLENTKSTHLYCVFFLYSSRLTPLCNKPRKIAKLARLSTAWSLDHSLSDHL